MIKLEDMQKYGWEYAINQVVNCDCMEGINKLPENSIDCVVTSPPYWNLRDYSVDGQIGMEKSLNEYLIKLWYLFSELYKKLKPTGTCFVNLGDTYGGSGDKEGYIDNKNTNRNGQKKSLSKNYMSKCLLQIPSRFAIGMTDRQYILRNNIIWHKSNAMPSSVLDRLTNKYEHIFFFTKNQKYYFDIDKIRIPYEGNEPRPPGIVRNREKGYNSKFGTLRREMDMQPKQAKKRRTPEQEYFRNPLGKIPGDVWTLNLQPSKYPHIAMYPEKLIAPLIAAGCPEGGIVLDPFMGMATTAKVAKDLGRNFIGFELNPDYCRISDKRIRQQILF